MSCAHPRIFHKLPDAFDGVRHLLVVTIDTEEEGRWGGTYSRDGNTCRNIEWLGELDPFEKEFGIKPTYLVDYPVATDPRAVDILRERVAGGRGEIGAHLHPWCNPPFDEIDRTCTYAGLLPEPLLRAKLGHLVAGLSDRFGIAPRSYRAGRWGFSASTLGILESLGMTVDSSVTPLRWEIGPRGAPSYLGAPSVPYFPDRVRLLRPGASPVLEIPVPSVLVGRGRAWIEALVRRGRPFRGLGRCLESLGLVWLRPSEGNPEVLREATRECLRREHPVLNVMFHSSELMPGASPYVKDAAGLRSFLDRFRAILETALQRADVLPVTLSEAQGRLVGPPRNVGAA